MLDKRVRHGMYGTRIYGIWAAMKARCGNPNYTEYELYGGRGVKVCEEWIDFMNFHEWAKISGYSDDLSIDRINNDGNYEPSNCKWSTPKEQANNRRSNRMISYKGKTMNLKEWASALGMGYRSLHKRINKGWSVEEAFTRPYREAR